MSIAGRFISAFQLSLGLWLAAFTLPKLHSLYQQHIDSLVHKGLDTAKARFFAVDRRVRAALIVPPILVAGVLLQFAP